MKEQHQAQILVEQVNLIYNLLPVGITATIINSSIITFLLWNLVPKTYLTIWLSIHLVFVVVRFFVLYIYKMDSLKAQHIIVWRNIFVFFLFLSGVIWGIASFFAFFFNSIAHQTLVAIVLGGMCAGAAATYSALRRAYYSFMIPTLLPQLLILFKMGDSLQIALGIMLLLFGILISLAAEKNNQIIGSNYLLVFKNEALIRNLQDSNEMAQTEILKRRKIQDELLIAQASLEQKVKNRTSELQISNDQLKTEIDKRVLTEQKLKESEEYYRTIVETAQEGIWVISDDHKVSYANERMAQMLGYSHSELQGKDLCNFVDCSQQNYHSFDRRLRGIRQKNLRKHDGSVIPVIEAESVLLKYEFGKPALRLGMVTDITDRQQWEQKIIDLNTQLLESNNELNEFSHSVSHDLQGPLSTIRSFSGMVIDEYGMSLDENGKNYVFAIQRSANRMSEIIKDLLTLSRVSRTELSRTTVNLSQLAMDVIHELKLREPKRNVDVTIEENIFADCDKGLIKIVLENLLNNAWKFTQKRELATITFCVRHDTAKNVFCIRDNGAGFDMKFKEMLFQPFKRLHKASDFPGTGIGLAIVHRIINKHNGEIWAESVLGNGATFYFTL